MASFNVTGLDGLALSFSELAALSNDTIKDMLHAGGDVIVKGQEQEVRAAGLVRSGKLAGSIKMQDKSNGAAGGPYVLIYPDGTHHTYRPRKSGGGVARNADVGFVHEFGGHGNAARSWMRLANEKHAGEAVAAEAAVYDRFVSGCGL